MGPMQDTALNCGWRNNGVDIAISIHQDVLMIQVIPASQYVTVLISGQVIQIPVVIVFKVLDDRI